VIAQEVVLIPVVHRDSQEEPADAQMSHLLEAAVGRIDSAADDGEALALNLLAEQIVLGIQDLLVKSTKLAESIQVEKHEHSCGEGMVEAGEVLEEIVARIKQFVDPITVAAQDVRGNAMKLLALGQFNGAAKYRRMSQFDVSVEKENIVALRAGRAKIAAHRGHSAADYADVQTVAKAKGNLRRAVGRVSVGHQHFRTRHLRVVLIRQ